LIVRSNVKRKFILVLIGAAFLSGCGHKGSSTESLQATVEKSTAHGGPLSGAKPEVKAVVDQAVVALKNDDQAGAVLSLRSLRDSGELTADQAMSVQDMMAKAQGILAERAARGDQSAIAALQMISINPR